MKMNATAAPTASDSKAYMIRVRSSSRCSRNDILPATSPSLSSNDQRLGSSLEFGCGSRNGTTPINYFKRGAVLGSGVHVRHGLGMHGSRGGWRCRRRGDLRCWRHLGRFPCGLDFLRPNLILERVLQLVGCPFELGDAL